MDQNLRVGLVLTAQDQGASGTVDKVASSVDNLSGSFNSDAKAAQNAKAGLDSLGASARSAMDLLRQMDALQATQAKTLADITQRRNVYAQALRADLITQGEYRTAVAAVDKAEQGLVRARGATTAATKAATAAGHDFIGMTNGAQRELGILAGELLRGNFAAFERSMITLTRQMGILQAAFSLTGGLIAAGVGIIAGLGAAYLKATEETDAYTRAVIANGNAAGLSVETLKAQEDQIGKAVGSYGNAREALLTLVQTGTFAGANLENVAQGIAAGAELTGKSVADMAGEFVKLQQDPTNAAYKLDQALNALSPSLLEQIHLLEESGDKAGAARLATDAFADVLIDRQREYVDKLSGIEKAWRDVKNTLDDTWQSAKRFMDDANHVGGFLSHPIDTVSNFLGDLKNQAFGGRSQSQQTAQNTAETERSTAAEKDNERQRKATQKAVDDETDALAKQSGVAGKTREQQVLATAEKRLANAATAEEADLILAALPAQVAYASKIDAVAAAKKHHVDVGKVENEVLGSLNAQIQKGIDIGGNYSAALSGPMLSAQRKFNQETGDLADAFLALNAKQALGKISTAEYDVEYGKLVDAFLGSADAYDLIIAKQTALNDLHAEAGTAVDQLLARWQAEERQTREGAEASDYAADKLRNEQAAMTALDKAIQSATSPEQVKALHDMRDGLLAKADAHTADAAAAKKDAAAMKEWQQIGVSAGNALASGIGDAVAQATFHFTSFSDFFKSIGSVLENTAQQVVSQIIAQFARLAIINPILNAVFGGSSGWSMLATLGSGGGGGAAGGGAGGGSGWIGQLGNTAIGQGVKGYIGQGAGWIASNPGLVGTVGSTAGAVGGAYYGYQHAGGGVGGVAAGLAYGTVGYIGGTALAGAAIGGATAAGVGGSVAAGAAAGGLGAGAGALAALGPIGWAALILVAVDMISGGKVFGTDANKFKFGQTGFTVDQGGGHPFAGYDMVGQHALFGGSYHEWTNVAPTPEAQAAADQFYNALKNGADDFAKEFGKTAGDLVGGTFKQNFDKKGNPTTSSSEVGGKTYNDTFAQFQERIQAENQLTVLEQFDSKLGAAIDKYRENADVLAGVTGNLATAQLAMIKGEKFLALGADQSTSALLAFAEANMHLGETVDQTLQRFIQAQAQYDQFVGQFKPATTYTDAFQEALAGIADQQKQNIQTANDLAIAAGGAGAAEEDLANIHKNAIAQFDALVKQLQDASQQLAISLGYTTQGMTVDQIDAEIQSIKNEAAQGANALHNFNGAIQATAEAAKRSMDLLLGDLSPLKDAEKLQTALKGLRAGTVSQDQVLEIGRRLYGSSQPYTDLFNMVQHFGGRGNASIGGGSAGSQNAPLTAAQRQKIADLEAQREQAMSAQRHTEALQLARNIADLSAVTGESYEEIAKKQGYDLDKLLDDLGLQNEDQLTKMLDGFKAQQNSAHQDSTDIYNAINDGFDVLITTLGGTPRGHSHHGDTVATGGDPAPPPPGSRGHSHRGAGGDMARGFLSVVGNAASANDRRNGRSIFIAPGARR